MICSARTAVFAACAGVAALFPPRVQSATLLPPYIEVECLDNGAMRVSDEVKVSMCSILLGGGRGLPRETVIPALLARSTAYTALGKNDKAIKDLLRIIQLDGENYNAYYRLAFAYEKEQQYDLAVQVYGALLSKSPAQSDAACFRNRDQALLNNVNASPESCGGKTSITGTR